MNGANSNLASTNQSVSLNTGLGGLCFESFPDELAAPLMGIQELFPERFGGASECWTVEFEHEPSDKPALKIDIAQGNRVVIIYSEPACAFRAIGILMGQLESRQEPESIHEQSSFQKIGAMVDASRNGVPHLDTIKKLIRHFALMGINQLMLYTEDTYEIPGEPLFGYFRGGYSQDELREIDDYAIQFGQEVVPCIQCLGHLEQVLQWPAYQDIKDTDGVLLAGAEQTRQFIERMIRAASAPFRSNRIHIGMDEAHGIGSGIYRLKHGLKPPFQILCDHLKETVESCTRHGLKPMIWSDMFFRLCSPKNSYYDTDSAIDPALAQNIPADVQLVYWDYYHTEKAFYHEWIQRHRALGKEPVFAAGIWTWNRFWAQLPHSIETITAGMQAAREEGLSEAFVTMWGDDGMECEIHSALPAVQCFADQAFSAIGTLANASQNFLGSVGGSFDQWLTGSQLDLVPVAANSDYEANASKWIFWMDPLFGHLERQLKPEFITHFKQISIQLSDRVNSRPADSQIEIVREAASLLALKTELHIMLRPAYRARNLDTLEYLNDSVINRLQRQLTAMRDLHETNWRTNFRCFGWDVIERRYAGLQSRLSTLQKKLCDFLDAPNTTIEELECDTALVWPHERTQSITVNYRQAASPSFIG